VYDPVPYFWSEQFGRMVQYVGHHGPADRLVWRGDPAEPKWTACWLTPPPDSVAADGTAGRAAGEGGRLTALLTVGRPRDMIQARRMIANRAVMDPARLADPAVPVKNAARLSGCADARLSPAAPPRPAPHRAWSPLQPVPTAAQGPHRSRSPLCRFPPQPVPTAAGPTNHIIHSSTSLSDFRMGFRPFHGFYPCETPTMSVEWRQRRPTWQSAGGRRGR
jgi:hypothetical protein